MIVPCYRHGIFLDDCIDSIKAQTWLRSSIVVVDDGSDDPETIEALARLDRDPESTVLRQPANPGPSAARNRALAELDASYVLPIDADDKLLPDALERMVARLEEAPAENVGYVYPHAQHFGNRSDYCTSPAYNLWLLMQENYFPAPALFDRRVFGRGGVAYPEDDRGRPRGLGPDPPAGRTRRPRAARRRADLPLPAPGLQPRQRGRLRARPFHATIERRHPPLYRNRDAIKAHWAPALSLVLYEEGGEAGAKPTSPTCLRRPAPISRYWRVRSWPTACAR